MVNVLNNVFSSQLFIYDRKMHLREQAEIIPTQHYAFFNSCDLHFSKEDSMHFWIDKRSQTCGFSGRHRVPASLSAQHRRRRRPRSKPMVTPVHRFQPIECVGGGQHGRRVGRQMHGFSGVGGVSNPGTFNTRSPGAHAMELDSSVFLDIPVESNTVTASHSHQLQPQLLPVGRLKCGMWASFALASVFVAGAKLYFDHQGAGLEVLVFCALLVVFLLAGCTVSVCRSKATRDLLNATVHTQPQPSLPLRAPTPVEEVPVPLPQPPQAPPATIPELPPPPYHIAVLLPLQDSQDAPPPSYDKAVS